MALSFEWDLRKAASNRKKHRVSFEEATSVFSDPLARIFDDAGHSAGEPREIIIGRSSGSRLLLVCFREMQLDRIRLISARFATKREQHDYEENVQI
jgi:uncharacterized DUF497 family protein